MFRILVLVIFLAASSFAVLTSMTTKIDADSHICENAISQFFVNWGAGCYYKVLFDEGSSIDSQRLEIERDKLEAYVTRQGSSPEILWYRLQLHQKYRHFFRTNFESSHFMYLDYLKSQHINLDRQVDYLAHLIDNSLFILAQKTLDDFCDTYILRRREAKIEEFRLLLSSKRVALSFEHCNLGSNLN